MNLRMFLEHEQRKSADPQTRKPSRNLFHLPAGTVSSDTGNVRFLRKVPNRVYQTIPRLRRKSLE